MILQQLRALSSILTTRSNRETDTQKPKPCHILNLPQDILEEIIRTHLAVTPGNHYPNAIKTLSLVHRSWLPTTRYLAYVKVTFMPKNVEHATRMLKHLKTHLPPTPAAHSDDFVPTEQSQRASCRTLFIGPTESETLVASSAAVFELFQLVGHSLRTLELRGLSGLFWKPTEALIATSKQTTFLPCLRQMKVLDVGPWTLTAYLCAIWKGDGKRGPGGLIVHHDFELSRERDLLSVPLDILEKEAKPPFTDHSPWSFNPERAWVTGELLPIADASPTSEEYVPPLEDNRRPPLELYISRRSHVGEFILTLSQAKFLINVLKRSVKTVDVWLKDREEVGTELASAIESKGWEHFIDRDIADGETTHSLLHEF